MVNIIYHKESCKLIFLPWNHKIPDQRGYKNIKLINLEKILNSINVQSTRFIQQKSFKLPKKIIIDLNY